MKYKRHNMLNQLIDPAMKRLKGGPHGPNPRVEKSKGHGLTYTPTQFPGIHQTKSTFLRSEKAMNCLSNEYG